MEISHTYTKNRKDFGRHARLVDVGPEMLADIRPNEEHADKYIEQRHVSVGIEALPQMSEHEVQTNPVLLANKSVNHVEGGWPKEIDPTDAELTIRYRKKAEKDEAYIKAVQTLGARAESILSENNAIDLYAEYFEEPGSNAVSSEAPSAKTVAILRDPSAPSIGTRAAVALSWHPESSGRIAVSYCTMRFQAQDERAPAHSYVWDMGNPNTPELELRPPSALTSLSFSLKDAHLLGSGQYNGQVTFFDTRRGSSPIDASQIEHSHRDPVFRFAWLQIKTGTEAASVSTDGWMLWWDVRKLAEPLERLQLTDKDAPLGAVSLDCSPLAGPTKFLVGTEGGLILSGNRRAKTPADRISAAYQGHHGSVVDVARNPFFPKFFLSAGDWSARIWSEDIRAPLISSAYSKSLLTAARWSPTRPGVFFTAKADGRLDVWDFMHKQHEPALSAHVADVPLTSLKLQESGRLCAVGSEDGSTTILQMSKGLVEAQASEKHAIGAILERESSREKNLEKAVKEAKIRARREASKAAEGGIKPATQAELDLIEEEFKRATGLA